MINIVLYQPEISPNTGNIIRTCYAVGAKLHIIEPTSFDLHPKWMKRPAAGKHLSNIRHEVHASYKDFVNKYKNVNMFYVTRYGEKTHSDINFSKFAGDLWFMFGRESTGIPLDILNTNYDYCIRIPMIPLSRSLNLANAVCIVVYEALRQLNYPNLSSVEVLKGKNWIKIDKKV